MHKKTRQAAVITVVGRDRVGIIAAVSGRLAEVQVNINDISQMFLQDIFTMIMLVDTSAMMISIHELSDQLEKLGESIGISIRVQHTDIFDAMHRV